MRGLEGIAASPSFSEYLRVANLSFSELSTDGAILANVTQFPLLTIAHSMLPKSILEWPRDELSLDRAAIIVVLDDLFGIETSGQVLRRDPGFYIVPPGDSHISLHFRSPQTETLYVSVDAASVSHLGISAGTPELAEPISWGAAAPLYSFLKTLTTITVRGTSDVEPLADATRAVVRSLVDLLAHGLGPDIGLFGRAMQVIVGEHTRVDLAVGTLASRLVVSSRTLQAAFAEEGTTVTRELRAVRARAALELRHNNPNLRAFDVATAVGFGSASSMLRALREFGPATGE